MADNLLYELTDIRHFYGAQPVLQVDRLTISAPSIIGLAGPNGSGKSTLLKILGLAIKPTRGEVRYMGRLTRPFSSDARLAVTLLPQEPYLMKRTVYDNLLYGLRVRKDRRDKDEKIRQALSWVGFTDPSVLKRKWYALSGGEVQRVALAARLVLKPAVLLLDEPTTNVDAESAALIRQAALKAKALWKTTLVIASHDWPWLYEVCDKVQHLYKGRLYGSRTEALVSGPWQPEQHGMWRKRLKNGSDIVVTTPPASDALALIRFEPVFVAVGKETGNDDVHYISGVVTRMMEERSTGNIIAVVGFGNLSVPVRCRRRQLAEAACFPGDRLCLSYTAADVRWV